MENFNHEKLTNPELDEASSTTPERPMKNEKIKWTIIGIIIGFVITAIIGVAFFLLYKTKTEEQPIQQDKSAQEKTTTEKLESAEDQKAQQEEKQEIETGWIISLSNQETTSDNSLAKNILLHATKEDYKVVVYQRDIRNGNQEIIFEYNEDKKAEKSGNLWKGLPPNIDLSPDEKSLVFIDQEGLKTYNLQTGSTRTFINKIGKVDPETEAPPRWSIDGLSAYTLARPKWSSDGQYISFLQSHYEGASFGVIDFLSGEYTSLDLHGGYRNLTWGPNGHSLIKPSAGAYEGIGLLFTSSNLEEIENLSEKFEKKEASFFEANFSPSSKKIVFTYREDWQSEDVKIGVVNTDGSQFLSIDEGNIQLPFFSNDGNSVLFIKKMDDEQYLFSYDFAKKEITIIATLPETFNRWNEAEWTQDGLLTVIGKSSSSDLVVGGDSTRLVILDIDNKKIIYASPVYNQFVNFAGFKK